MVIIYCLIKYLNLNAKFSKKILQKVSFDPSLFKKELAKSAKWLNKQEMRNLKIWALTYLLIIRRVYLRFLIVYLKKDLID